MTVLDHLGIGEFVTLGWSGGGPRALACAALLPGRCRAVATLAGIAPYASEGLDWFDGMAPENVEDFTLAATGDVEAYQALLEKTMPPMFDASPADVAAAFGQLVTPVDAAALTGEFAEFASLMLHRAGAQGVVGVRDDGLALVAPWGFDLGDIAVPVAIWQGRQDAMVPVRARRLAGEPRSGRGGASVRGRGAPLARCPDGHDPRRPQTAGRGRLARIHRSHVAVRALTVRPLTVRVLTMDAPELTSTLDLVRWIGWAQLKAGEDWIRDRELSHPQSFVLGYLVQNPGAIQRDIAEVSRTSAASVSSLLQGLERRGLVERRTEDGNERSKRVYATQEGDELIAGFDTAMAAADETILAPLNQPSEPPCTPCSRRSPPSCRSRPAPNRRTAPDSAAQSTTPPLALRAPASVGAPRTCPRRSRHDHHEPRIPAMPTPSAPTAGTSPPRRSPAPSCTSACRWPPR